MRLDPAACRQLARLLNVKRECLTKSNAVLMATIETDVPALTIARDLMERFHYMLRTRNPGGLSLWIGDTTKALLASFGKGVRADYDAVRAALIEPGSNGQTEGQITKLQLVKRQMYGRAKLDLMRARLVVA